MKRFKKFALLCALTGPAAINMSCTTAFFQEARDQFLAGFGAVVNDVTVNALSPFFAGLGL